MDDREGRADVEVVGECVEKIGDDRMCVVHLDRVALCCRGEILTKFAKPAHRIGRVPNAFLREIGLRAVVRLDEFVTQNSRVNPPPGDFALEHVSHREKIALALGHFLAFDHQIARVNPVLGKMRLARGTARLGNFAFVVRKNIVLASGVDVDHLAAQQFHRHRRAFDVPARIALAPR